MFDYLISNFVLIYFLEIGAAFRVIITLKKLPIQNRQWSYSYMPYQKPNPQIKRNIFPKL